MCIFFSATTSSFPGSENRLALCSRSFAQFALKKLVEKAAKEYVDLYTLAIPGYEGNESVIFKVAIYCDYYISVAIFFANKSTNCLIGTLSDYPGSLPVHLRPLEKKGNIAEAVVNRPIDIEQMCAICKFTEPEVCACVDHQTGSVTVYRINGFEKEEVKWEMHGAFSTSESYVILYRYRSGTGGVEKALAYFWHGSSSTVMQQGTSAMITIEIAGNYSGDISHARLIESKGWSCISDRGR